MRSFLGKFNKKVVIALCATLSISFALLGSYQAHCNRLNTPYLTIIGGVNIADGLGRQSVEMIDALKGTMKIQFMPTYIDKLLGAPEFLAPFIEKKKKRLGTVVFCQEPIKQCIKKLRTAVRPDQIRIAYSMFESSEIPPGWVKRFNRYFDLVAVPDPFLVEVYQKSGVKIPVFVLPLGRDFHSFLKAPLKSKKNSPFVFGCFSAGLGRKNHIGLIRAFNRAFHDRPDVVLAIHCRNFCDLQFREQLLEEISQAKASIRFTENPLDPAAYLSFLQSIDCYVNPSKGEGFSIQPREAMALGIPAIVTDNTAQHTICKSGLVRAVPSQIQEPAIYEWCSKPAGSFYLCTEEALADALLDVENNFDSYLAKGAAARSWASQYDYENIKPLYLSLLKPKEIILGSEDKITPDCLVTTSKTLYKKYQRLTR